MPQIDIDTFGLPTLNQIYHFIKSKFEDDGIGTPAVPSARVVSEAKTMDAENKIQLDELDSKRRRMMKPHSMHFLSLPVQYEYSPIYEVDGQKFHGHPLPIFDSLANNSKSITVIVLSDKDILAASLFVSIEYVIFVVVPKILSASLSATNVKEFSDKPILLEVFHVGFSSI